MRYFKLALIPVLFLAFCQQEKKKMFLRKWFSPSWESFPIRNLIETCAITSAGYSGPIAPITSGYGTPITKTLAVTKYQNPRASSRAVCVYYPQGLAAKTPTLFLFHGFGSPSAEPYMPLIEFLVGKGYVVVFPIYFSDTTTSAAENYAIMKAGMEYAVTNSASIIDTTKVGFLGHSYGGGAVPYLSYEGLLNNKWGTSASFLFTMAPFYSLNITNTQLAQFPSNTKFITQVYEEDKTCDHRMAKDIFENISISTSEKDFVTLFTDKYENYTLSADHVVPIKAIVTGEGALNGLDFYGIYRLLDALIDYSFNGSTTAKTTALGGGNTTQKFMGTYPNGTSVKNLDATDSPILLKPESYYSQPWSSSNNPRK